MQRLAPFRHPSAAHVHKRGACQNALHNTLIQHPCYGQAPLLGRSGMGTATSSGMHIPAVHIGRRKPREVSRSFGCPSALCWPLIRTLSPAASFQSTLTKLCATHRLPQLQIGPASSG